MKESPLGSQRPSRIPSPAQRQHSQVAAPPGEQINTECSSAAEKRDGRETLTEEEIAKRQQIKENERQAKARRKRAAPLAALKEKDSIRAKAAADLKKWQLKEEERKRLSEEEAAQAQSATVEDYAHTSSPAISLEDQVTARFMRQHRR